MYGAARPWSAASQPRPARSWSTACTARAARCAPAWPPRPGRPRPLRCAPPAKPRAPLSSRPPGASGASLPRHPLRHAARPCRRRCGPLSRQGVSRATPCPLEAVRARPAAALGGGPHAQTGAAWQTRRPLCRRAGRNGQAPQPCRRSTSTQPMRLAACAAAAGRQAAEQPHRQATAPAAAVPARRRQPPATPRHWILPAHAAPPPARRPPRRVWATGVGKGSGPWRRWRAGGGRCRRWTHARPRRRPAWPRTGARGLRPRSGALCWHACRRFAACSIISLTVSGTACRVGWAADTQLWQTCRV